MFTFHNADKLVTVLSVYPHNLARHMIVLISSIYQHVESPGEVNKQDPLIGGELRGHPAVTQVM